MSRYLRLFTHTAVVWRLMGVTMIARTAAGIVIVAMTAIHPLPSGLLTVLCIIPIALRPVLLARHQFIEARQDTGRISTGMVTERLVNDRTMQPL